MGDRDDDELRALVRATVTDWKTVPPEQRPFTAYITDHHAPMTHYVVCPVCGGRVGFNLEELKTNPKKSVYCAGRYDLGDGRTSSTTSGQDPHNHWHPSNALTDAGEIHEFVWAGDETIR